MKRYLLILALAQSLAASAGDFGQIYEWGINIVGRNNAMTITDARLLTANSDWSMVLRMDGSLFAWGSNTYGQTNVPSGNHFRHCHAGWHHGIAATTNGTVVEWGIPFGKEIDTWERLRPTITNAIRVAAGDDHSAALLADGTVLAWGGRSAVTNRSGTIRDAMQIDSGWYHLVVLHSNGTVSAFGQASQPNQYFDPPAGLSNVVRVVASQFASYAIKSDGTLVAWGMPDTYGQMTPPAGQSFIDVAGGRDHTIALRSDGTVILWGDNKQEQLVVPPSLDQVRVTHVAAGRYHSLAIRRVVGPPTNLRVVNP